MNILYGGEKIVKDTYKYRINQGGELDIKVSNGINEYVLIVFIDGKLDSVCHSLGNSDLRSNWHVYGAIAEKIKEIENKYIMRNMV